jgi:hypothetical protein
VSEFTPTRSAVIGLKEERRAMQEGYVFLDEKCLLLAAAMLRELKRYDHATVALRTLLARAGETLADSVNRHGLQEMQCCTAPGSCPEPADTTLAHGRGAADATATRKFLRSRSPYILPEVGACRDAFAALTAHLAEFAAVAAIWSVAPRMEVGAARPGAAGRVAARAGPRPVRDRIQLDELERDEALGARWGRRGV